jgi:hypothetical protein
MIEETSQSLAQPEAASSANVEPSSLKDEVRRLIMANEGATLYASALGNRLSKSLGVPLSEALNGQKFTDFLTNSMEGEILLSGVKDSLIVTRVDALPNRSDDGPKTLIESDSRSDHVKYDRNFWDAFIRPLRRGSTRAILPGPPVQSADWHASGPPEGWISVDASLIPSAEQSWPVRKKAANLAIARWCKTQGYDRHRFAEQKLSMARYSNEPPMPREALNVEAASSLLMMLDKMSEIARSSEVISISLLYSILRRHG